MEKFVRNHYMTGLLRRQAPRNDGAVGATSFLYLHPKQKKLLFSNAPL